MSICEELVEKEKDTIKRLIDLSERMGVEIGSYVCRDEELKLGNICTGTACAVAVEDCREGEPIGYFHTHPKAETEVGKLPSRGDLGFTAFKKLQFACLGYREGGVDKITCFCPPESGTAEFWELSRVYRETEEEIEDLGKRVEEYYKEKRRYEEELKEYRELEEKCRREYTLECEILQELSDKLSSWYRRLAETWGDIVTEWKKLGERRREALAKYGKCFCEAEVND